MFAFVAAPKLAFAKALAPVLFMYGAEFSNTVAAAVAIRTKLREGRLLLVTSSTSPCTDLTFMDDDNDFSDSHSSSMSSPVSITSISSSLFDICPATMLSISQLSIKHGSMTTSVSASVSLGSLLVDAVFSRDRADTVPTIVISTSTSVYSLSELSPDSDHYCASFSSIASELEEQIVDEEHENDEIIDEEYKEDHIDDDEDELFPGALTYEHGQPLDTITEEDEDEVDGTIAPSIVSAANPEPFVSRFGPDHPLERIAEEARDDDDDLTLLSTTSSQDCTYQYASYDSKSGKSLVSSISSSVYLFSSLVNYIDLNGNPEDILAKLAGLA